MTSPCLVYVIDDDEPVRAAVVFALETVGYRTAAYADADEFLGREDKETGVIVSDVRMPGTNGIELAHWLRRSGSKMPIILMTGHADVQLQSQPGSVGWCPDLILEKPVALGVLVAEIESRAVGWT